MFGGGTIRRVSCRADWACDSQAAKNRIEVEMQSAKVLFIGQPNFPQSGQAGKAKGPAELHVFQMGAHGFVNKGGGADHFVDRLEEWLRSNKLLTE